MHRVALLLLLLPATASARKPAPAPAPIDLAVRWTRTAEEWGALTRTVYASALGALLDEALHLPPGTPWVVVSDLDETLLDNSVYQLEIAGVGHSEARWAAWEARAEAVPMPGAVDFVARVHAAGGAFAYVTNRENAEATLRVLTTHGLFTPADVLCVKTTTSDKAPRRAALRAGDASCGWAGEARPIVGWLGDQITDFPAPGEEAATPFDPWGDRWFMLPNPMYGRWSSRDPWAPRP